MSSFYQRPRVCRGGWGRGLWVKGDRLVLAEGRARTLFDLDRHEMTESSLMHRNREPTTPSEQLNARANLLSELGCRCGSGGHGQDRTAGKRRFPLATPFSVQPWSAKALFAALGHARAHIECIGLQLVPGERQGESLGQLHSGLGPAELACAVAVPRSSRQAVRASVGHQRR